MECSNYTKKKRCFARTKVLATMHICLERHFGTLRVERVLPIWLVAKVAKKFASTLTGARKMACKIWCKTCVPYKKLADQNHSH